MVCRPIVTKPLLKPTLNKMIAVILQRVSGLVNIFHQMNLLQCQYSYVTSPSRNLKSLATLSFAQQSPYRRGSISDRRFPSQTSAIMWKALPWHDDVIKWKHFPRYWPSVRGIHRSPVNSTHKGQWRGALMFSLICVWIKGWENNREAGDLRRYRAHCDVTVMAWHDLWLHASGMAAYGLNISIGSADLTERPLMQSFDVSLVNVLARTCCWTNNRIADD